MKEEQLTLDHSGYVLQISEEFEIVQFFVGIFLAQRTNVELFSFRLNQRQLNVFLLMLKSVAMFHKILQKQFRKSIPCKN